MDDSSNKGKSFYNDRNLYVRESDETFLIYFNGDDVYQRSMQKSTLIQLANMKLTEGKEEVFEEELRRIGFLGELLKRKIPTISFKESLEGIALKYDQSFNYSSKDFCCGGSYGFAN